MLFEFSPKVAMLRPHKHRHQLNFNDKPFLFPIFAVAFPHISTPLPGKGKVSRVTSPLPLGFTLCCQLPRAPLEGRQGEKSSPSPPSTTAVSLIAHKVVWEIPSQPIYTEASLGNGELYNDQH